MDTDEEDQSEEEAFHHALKAQNPSSVFASFLKPRSLPPNELVDERTLPRDGKRSYLIYQKLLKKAKFDRSHILHIPKLKAKQSQRLEARRLCVCLRIST